MSENEIQLKMFAAMQLEKPFKTYRKTVLGRVSVNYIEPFSGKPSGIILMGNPKTDETARIDTWTEVDDSFFRKMNKRHFEVGNLLEMERIEEVKERTIESFNDEELTKIINSKYFSLQAILDSTTSVAVLFRMVELAKELEKSDKIMKALESRISELQATPVVDSTIISL